MVRILAVEDEPLALEMMAEAIRRVCPQAELQEFTAPSRALAFARENPCDIAFLDIRMRGMSGVELARQLRQLLPRINIIFVTSYDEFTGDAMRMHASGYIMKPVTEEKVRGELADLRYGIGTPGHEPSPPEQCLLQIHCFGNFDVFTADQRLIHFERSRAKETLAYLVYRRGASCTVREIASVLFEDESYDKRQQAYAQKIISSMLGTLKKYRAEAVIEKSYNSMALNTALVSCDYYNYIAQQNGAAKRFYPGEFMAQYSWAEYMTGYLNRIQNGM